MGSRWGLVGGGAAVVLLRRCSAFMMRLLPATCYLLPATCYLLPAARLMTTADSNDLMPAQEKLEWVTPKISLMEAGDTDSTKPFHTFKEYNNLSGPS